MASQLVTDATEGACQRCRELQVENQLLRQQLLRAQAAVHVTLADAGKQVGESMQGVLGLFGAGAQVDARLSALQVEHEHRRKRLEELAKKTVDLRAEVVQQNAAFDIDLQALKQANAEIKQANMEKLAKTHAADALRVMGFYVLGGKKPWAIFCQAAHELLDAFDDGSMDKHTVDTHLTALCTGSKVPPNIQDQLPVLLALEDGGRTRGAHALRHNSASAQTTFLAKCTDPETFAALAPAEQAAMRAVVSLVGTFKLRNMNK